MLLLSGPSWGRRAAALVAAAVGAALLAPVASADPDRPDPSARTDATARLAGTGGGLRAADVRLTSSTQTVESDPFAMVGVTWTGAPPRDVRVRTRSDGAWTPWRVLEMLHDGPDGDTSVRRGTDLAWVGEADAVRVSVGGPRPTGLTLVLLDPTGTPSASARTVAERPAGRSLKPRLRSRASWGADPSWREMPATYNRTIQQVHVHHTVNSNSYAPGDVPGLLRGIYRYHTHSLGWSDIGYNFLVDRFGRIWVGRGGGASRSVRGAHTLGFNSTSTGVAVIGNFEAATPSVKVIGALARISGWKLHTHDRNPTGRVRVYSHGSDRYAAGRTVTLPTIDGHRDTSQTACPGARLYARLPDIRRRAAAHVRRTT
jgi:uncharacterized protein with LGFP repeats